MNQYDFEKESNIFSSPSEGALSKNSMDFLEEFNKMMLTMENHLMLLDFQKAI